MLNKKNPILGTRTKLHIINSQCDSIITLHFCQNLSFLPFYAFTVHIMKICIKTETSREIRL